MSSQRRLLVDTNLLLVFIVGATDRLQVGRARRTEAYTVADFDLLASIIGAFPTVVVTSNILTEVSNLAGHLTDPLRTHVFQTLAALVPTVAERYVPSEEAVRTDGFVHLGLADISVLLAAGQDTTVLTVDAPLYEALWKAGVEAKNFHHVRTGATEM